MHDPARFLAPGSSSQVPAVLGQLERGAAQAADDRAVLDLLGRELEAARLGLAGALGSDPPPAALGGFARAVAALVLAAVVRPAGAGRAGQVGQEREPGRVDPGGHLGLGVVGGLPVQGAVRPAGDLVRHVRAAQAQLGRQGDEPLVVVAVPGGAGVLDAAPGGQGVGGLVQHDLHDRAAPGRQQLPGDEQLGGPRLVLAAEDPSFGPVVAAQLVPLRGAFLVGPGPGHDHDIGHVRVGVLDGGPGVFEGGDDPASVLFDDPGVGHGLRLCL